MAQQRKVKRNLTGLCAVDVLHLPEIFLSSYAFENKDNSFSSHSCDFLETGPPQAIFKNVPPFFVAQFSIIRGLLKNQVPSFIQSSCHKHPSCRRHKAGIEMPNPTNKNATLVVWIHSDEKTKQNQVRRYSMANLSSWSRARPCLLFLSPPQTLHFHA